MFSCTRPSSNEATVTFDLPASYWINQGLLQQNQSNYVSNLLNINQNPAPVNISSTGPITNYAPSPIWDDVIPTGYQTGPYDNNCLFIVATGPELERFACYKNNVATPVFRVGEISNPKLVGSQISLSVTPGSGRVFLLLGMHASSPEDCKEFKDPTFNRGNLSKPYIIGKTETVTVEAGADNRFSLPAISGIDSNEYIEYCDAAEVEGIYSPPTTLTVGKFELSFDRELTKNVTYNNQCMPITVRLKDSTGLINMESPFVNNFSLETQSSVALNVYLNAQDCVNSANVRSEFTTFKNFETTVWIRAIANDLGSQAVRFRGMVGDDINVSRAGPAASLESIKVSITEQAQVVASAGTKMAITKAPERILNDTCYHATLSANNGEFSVPGFFETGGDTAISYTDVNASAALTFYDGPDCLTGATQTVTHGNFAADHAFINVWFKVAGYNPGNEITLIHSYIANTTTYVKTKMTVVGGGTDPIKLKLSGPKFLESPGSNSCYGPYRVEMVNPAGASVLSTVLPDAVLPKDFNIRINFDNISTTKLFARGANGTTVACDPTREIRNGDQVVLPESTGYYEFYVRIQSYTTDPASLSRYITVTDITANANGSYLPSGNQLLQILSVGVPNNNEIPPPPICNGPRFQPESCSIP